ncbi:DUF1420 family protein [filamentous cyanobacterium LEGE 11480]|uniref:DUF1420 family protein n=1 Tax=Romeriopsis navalis LEGE 11480 TaxID=2777977 RepID=A0A928VPJ4_9CYAN|nr:glycosyltransferase family 39 protein [Romeriopsis navalis]MBE9030265.1 DUF1420 family protein [Romeriopsis navalis LEGE 11480]
MSWSTWAVAFLVIYYRQVPRTLGLWWQDGEAFQLYWQSACPAIILGGIFTLFWCGARWMGWSQQRLVIVLVSSVVILAGAVCLPGSWLLQFMPAAPAAMGHLARGMGGTGGLLLAAAICGAGVGSRLRWQFENPWEQWVYQVMLGCGLLAYLAAALSIVHQYSAIGVRFLVVGILVIGSWHYAMPFYQWCRSVVRKAVEAIDAKSRPVPFQMEFVWQALGLWAMVCAWLTALAPETQYDALWYHLGFARLWLEQGAIVDFPREMNALLPMTWDVLFGVGLSLGAETGAKLLHFVCLPATAIVVYQMTRRFVPLASPWFAVALFVTVPTIFWESTTAYVDLALTMYVALAIYALLRYWEVPQGQWLWLAGLNIGWAMSIKHLAIPVLGLMVVGVILQHWFVVRSMVAQPSVVPMQNRQRLLRRLLCLILLALCLALPWYVRSWLATGNPVFPAMFRLFGAPPERWDAIAEITFRNFLDSFGRSRSLGNLLALPWDMTIHAARYAGSLGPLFLLLIPALCFYRLTHSIRWLAGFVLLYMIFWASPLSNFQIRFVLIVTPFLAVMAAAATAYIGRSFQAASRWGMVAFYAGLGLLLPLNLPPFTAFHEGDRVQWDGWFANVIYHLPLPVVVGMETREAYLTRQVSAYAAWQYVNAMVEPSAQILSFVNGNYFHSQRAIWAYYILPMRPAITTQMDQVDEALACLAKHGIHYVIFDRRQLAAEHKAFVLTQPQVIQQHYKLLYEDANVLFYQINH